uniref:Putative small GTP-binding protein Rab5b n=1 Tax=Trypanosoma congolense (strain IL3000) TaxID=1068625 RepID=G0V091_TRYCI|nr:putative small GTP-binding protein Rab5b [Trypanosoma congolense IL3000]
MSTKPASAPMKKYKIVLLGDSGVGKSSLVQRLAKNEWCENQNSTVGASFLRYVCSVGDTTVNFDIWDTAGQERYKSLASMYYRGAAAALVVYEIPSWETFERAKHWVRELAANSPETIVILVGNKSDLRGSGSATMGCVSTDEASTYARELNLLFSEASAKDGSGVREVFTQIAQRLVASNNTNTVRGGGVLGAKADHDKKGSGCCR